MTEDKRGYIKHEDSPGLSRDEDRRRYDKWYYHNKRGGTGYKRKSYEEKRAYWDSVSETYWRGYCEENGLDPDTWRKVKKQVRQEKRLERFNRWRYRPLMAYPQP